LTPAGRIGQFTTRKLNIQDALDKLGVSSRNRLLGGGAQGAPFSLLTPPRG
jgi:hypothetical protein